LFSDDSDPSRARWHALWAMDAIDRGVFARKAIRVAAKGGEAGVRRQAIRQLGMRRVADARPELVAALSDLDASVRFAAATALGRIGDAAAVADLIPALADDDAVVRYACFTALNRMGRAKPQAWSDIAAALSDARTKVRDGAAFALRETYDEALVDALVHCASDTKDADAKARAVTLLGELALQRPVWKGEWWAYHPALRLPPAKSATWQATERIRAALGAMLTDAAPEVRGAAVIGLAKSDDAASVAKLRAAVNRESDETVRIELVAALGALRDRASSAVVAAIISDSAASAKLRTVAVKTGERIGGDAIGSAVVGALLSSDDRELRLASAEALAKLKPPRAVAALAPLAVDVVDDVRRAALDALAKIGSDSALQAVIAAGKNDADAIRCDAVASLGDFSQAGARTVLLDAYGDAKLRSLAIAALAQRPHVAALAPYLDGLASADAELRERCRRAIHEIRDAALPTIEKQSKQLAPQVAARLQDIYRDHAAARRGPLFAVATETFDPQKYLDHVRSSAGDPVRGRERFFAVAGMGCAKCHRVGNEGGEIGPDLSNIGEQFDRVQLAEHVLFPSRAIRDGYQEIVVRTMDGQQIAGIMRSENEQTLTLRDASGKDFLIPKEEIDERRLSGKSAMPEGLAAAVPMDGVADLVAYLSTLRSRAN
jgi:putative heme-binding domain-containing protein